jgi:hypothetical protein
MAFYHSAADERSSIIDFYVYFLCHLQNNKIARKRIAGSSKLNKNLTANNEREIEGAAAGVCRVCRAERWKDAQTCTWNPIKQNVRTVLCVIENKKFKIKSYARAKKGFDWGVCAVGESQVRQCRDGRRQCRRRRRAKQSLSFSLSPSSCFSCLKFCAKKKKKRKKSSLDFLKKIV